MGTWGGGDMSHIAPVVRPALRDVSSFHINLPAFDNDKPNK